MKKKFLIFPIMLVILISAMCLISGCASTSASNKIEVFEEFSLNEDLAWLKGNWKLEKWEIYDHGVIKDRTNIYKTNVLSIDGIHKYSKIVETTENASDGEVYSNSYTIEDYFMLNSSEAGYKNKVNQSKNKLLLIREYALDPEIIFHLTYIKQK